MKALRAKMEALGASRKRTRESEELQAAKKPSPTVMVPSPAPADIRVGINNARPEYKMVSNPKQPLFATVKVGENGYIGNQFGPMNGYDVKIFFDGGRYGLPHIDLRFRINKGSYDEPVPQDSNQIYCFKITFRFDSQAGQGDDGQLKQGLSVMGFQHYHINHLNPPTPEDRVAVEGLPPGKIGVWGPTLTTFILASSRSYYIPDDIPDLNLIKNAELRSSVAALLTPQNLKIQIWFHWRNEEVANITCFRHMRSLYEQRLLPLSRCYEGAGSN